MKNGWYIKHGYELFTNYGITLRIPVEDFWRRCGTSNIVRPGVLGLLGDIDNPTDHFLRHTLVKHALLGGDLASRGAPLAALPFPGAVDRRGHVNSASSYGRSVSLLRRFVINYGLFETPRQNLWNLSQVRPVDRAFRREFMGGPDRTRRRVPAL